MIPFPAIATLLYGFYRKFVYEITPAEAGVIFGW